MPYLEDLKSRLEVLSAKRHSANMATPTNRIVHSQKTAANTRALTTINAHSQSPSINRETVDAIRNESIVRSPKPEGSRDKNGNYGWLKQRECPNCKFTDGLIWTYPACKLLISDRDCVEVYLDRHPQDSDVVICECCGTEGPFSEWEFVHEEEQEKHYFEAGDEIAVLRRRSGYGRQRVTDLFKFTAKKGNDNVVRWCINRQPMSKNIKSQRIARHLCRVAEIPFINKEIKHRQKVETKGFVAERTLSQI